ncbi:MAG: hypothetical protein F6K08_26470 [Okeania sp. SIO1H6]|nr:hypothetical protein [Okeania sp. SIO1H6]
MIVVEWPKWIPHDYRKLWKDDNHQAFNSDNFDDLEMESDDDDDDFDF